MDNDKKLICVNDIMSEIYNMEDLPFLDIGFRMGHTGYVDIIEENELKHPITKSKDDYNRPVIIIKFIANDIIFAQTFFQRYTDDKELWMGTRVIGPSPSFMCTIGGMTRHQANLLLNVSKGNKVMIDKDHKTEYINNKSLVGKTVLLYDKKKNDAAIIIQCNWDICRYNTRYKIARDYVMRDYEEYVRDIKSF